MRHRRPAPFILLSACSSCGKDFKDGKPRHMLGTYPMEQFCTYRCVEAYLEKDHGLKKAIPLPAPRHLESSLNRP